jgi:hypothetical protein
VRAKKRSHAQKEEAFQTRLAAARQESTRVRERALQATLDYVLRTVPLSDEARERITSLLAGGGDEG